MEIVSIHWYGIRQVPESNWILFSLLYFQRLRTRAQLKINLPTSLLILWSYLINWAYRPTHMLSGLRFRVPMLARPIQGYYFIHSFNNNLWLMHGNLEHNGVMEPMASLSVEQHLVTPSLKFVVDKVNIHNYWKLINRLT